MPVSRVWYPRSRFGAWLTSTTTNIALMEESVVQQVAKLAQRAFDRKEIPVGAVIIDSRGRVIAQGYNRSHAKRDITEHAEIVALRQAFKKMGDWRLTGCTLVVNLEPCLMCLGAIANARLKKVIYFLADPSFGSAESKLTRAQLKKLFPRLIVEKIVDRGETQALLQQFFSQLRSNRSS
ncbi:MAG: nucleoside deaminase [bacterium]